jgi:GGDEF domain-containing protein
MNRRFVAAFAAVCIVAALAAAASVAYRVLAGDSTGRTAAKADFEGLVSVLAYVKSSSDLADPGLRARLASRYEANPSLLLVEVYELGAGDRWRIPADSPYLSSLRAEGGLPRPAYPPRSTILLSSPLKGDSSGTMAVDALYTSLTQISAFEAFRDAMIGLAAFLALAALFLAIVSGSDMAGLVPRPGLAGEPPSPAHRRGAAASSGAELAAAAAEYQFETLSAADAEREKGPSTGIAVKELALPAEEDFDIPVMMEEPAAVAAHAAPSSDVDEPSAPGPRECGDEPAGLYSPASGLGWESYMKDRLDAEISRSASFEQDLSLLVICHDGLTSQDTNYAAFGDSIERFFSFRDLAFERGDDGFSVILPNIDSSHALRMAEEFYKKLVFLAEGDFAELDLLPLFMGISSRSGRLVDAVRMIEEADAALEKARYEKDSRIVAFKPDPDKYRLFLASKGA